MHQRMCSCARSEAFECSESSCGAQCAVSSVQCCSESSCGAQCVVSSYGAQCSGLRMTNSLTGTAVRCRYKPWGAHQPHHCGKGSCASVHGIRSPMARLAQLGWRTFILSSPIISHFWRWLQQGASSLEGWSVISELIITFCTTSSLTLKSHLYISNIKEKSGG